MALKLLAIFSVLVVHITLRLYLVAHRPLIYIGWWYPHSYSTALSLLAHRGYHRLPIGNDPASQPLKQFLDCRKNGISKEEFAAYLRSIPEQQSADIGNYAHVDSGRVFDLFVAAAVWKTFGISWSALTRFYVLISAMSCLAIFATTWRISRNFWAGALAAAIFSIAPYEIFQGVNNVRDTTPTWFTAFSLCTFFCLANRFQANLANYATYFFLGLVAMLGYGWRADCLVLPFFLLPAAIVRLWACRRDMTYAATAVGCFLLGGFVVWAVIKSACDAPPNAKANFFHVAFFGEETRCNLLGIENSLQIFRDDSSVAENVFAFHDANEPQAPPPVYCGEGYGKICLQMYAQALKHNLYWWVLGAPQTLWQVMHGCPQDCMSQAELISSLVTSSSPRAGKAVSFALHGWVAVAPLLFLAGCLGLWSRLLDRVAIGLLLLFFCYFAAIWFSVAPEYRHWGPLLVVLSVVGGLSLPVTQKTWTLILSRPWPWASIVAKLRSALTVFVCVCVGWFTVARFAYAVSSRQRQAYLQDISLRAAKGVDFSGEIDAARSFSVCTEAAGTRYTVGYLLKIETGRRPGELTCSHLRLAKQQLIQPGSWNGSGNPGAVFEEMRRVLWWNAFSQTRHRLQPNAAQYFFVSFLRSPTGGDTRRYAMKVEVRGEARIVQATRVDLTGWKKLPVSTVLTKTESRLVSPYVGGQTTRTEIQFSATPKHLAVLGFPRVHP